MIPRIARSLIGKKIVGVAVQGDIQDYGGCDAQTGDGDTTSDAYVPGGDIYLKFKTGEILKCWNSEWGGVQLLRPGNAKDAREIDFVERELLLARGLREAAQGRVSKIREEDL
jgi:hypothetical protein